MIVSVHQPNYIPWIGYFDKVEKSDIFIILDDVDHNKRGFTHRNKIKTMHGEKYLTIPLLNKGDKIKNLKINNEIKWQEQHYQLIKENYGKCEFWEDHRKFIEEIYSKKYELIIDFNMAWLNYILQYLQIETKIVLESEIEVELGKRNEKIINICKYYNAEVYLSGMGAKKYNDHIMYKDNNIDLVYQEFIHPIYNQQWDTDFYSHMSVIDALLNLGIKTKDCIGK